MSRNYAEKKSKISGNKKVLSALALLLMFTMTLPLAAMQIANAHTPPWDEVSYAYIVVAPNPIGVNQKVSGTVFVDTPMPGAVVGNDIRRHEYTVNIMRPDGKNDTKHWAVVSDTTGLQFFQYTPTLVGTYTFEFIYPKQTFTWVSGQYQNDTYQAASRTTTLTVQADPLPAAIDSYPLPTEYWTYPIEGQNTYWFSVSSNFLGQPYTPGAGATYGIPGNIQPEGPGPNSAHIMWSKPLQFGGVYAGSDNSYIPGEMYYTGSSYNARYSNPLIMYGMLLYAEPYGNGGGGGDYVAVDLRTGQEIWRINTTATGINLVPSFGYNYAYDSPNQHGVLPNGLLIATSGSTWRAYDPLNGRLTGMNLTSVPSGGAAIGGPSGEYLRLILTNLGNSTNPNWYLAQWNSSNVFGGGSGLSPANWYSGNVPANCPITPGPPNSTNTNWNGTMWVNSTVRSSQGYTAVSTPAYDWNISVSLPGTGWAITNDLNGVIKYAKLDNIMLVTQGSLGGRIGDYMANTATTGANITAISLKPTSRGTTLWTQYYPPAPGNQTRSISGWDVDAGVFVFWDKEDMVRWGYSLQDGSYLWGPTARPTDSSWDFNYLPCTDFVYYGKLYVTGYNGLAYAYDVKTGKLLWTYGNGGVGNSTDSGLGTPWGFYPIFVDVIADGKIYLSTCEHSPNSPLYKDALFRAIDAETGKEVWTLMGYATNMYGGTDAIADGYLAFANMYDMQIYSVGKGPSATAVSIQDNVVTQGDTVLITGTVTDIAAGTKQPEQAARFPSGVPAVSDADMGKWMQYVYMQKPKPANVTGVNVQLTITGPEGNNYGASAVSDDQGNFATTWSAPTAGTYKVTAMFTGSASYWPSSAGTYFAAVKAPAPAVVPTPTPVPPTPTPPATATPASPSPSQPAQPPTQNPNTALYVGISAVVIIAIIAAAAMILRRRK